MSNKQILVSEVGPRDGLQSIEAILPTEIKKKWIHALVEAGIREIEVGSFVPAPAQFSACRYCGNCKICRNHSKSDCGSIGAH